MTAGAFSQHALERETRAAAPPPGLPPQHSIGARHRFVDRPLNETIYLCFAYGQGATAERLRTELKVPERRWWRLKQQQVQGLEEVFQQKENQQQPQQQQQQQGQQEHQERR